VNLPDVALARCVLRANGHTACERSPAYSITRETWFCRTFAEPESLPASLYYSPVFRTPR
jgi:hypothetical protein